MQIMEKRTSFGVIIATRGFFNPIFTGSARKDIVALVGHAAARGLYGNLITSGVLLDDTLLADLAAAGLPHVQISLQGAEAATADRIAGLDAAHDRKLAAARRVTAAGMALTLNAVMHRQNLDQLEAIISRLGMIPAAESVFVQHLVQKNTGVITCERSSRSVRPVHSRCKTND